MSFKHPVCLFTFSLVVVLNKEAYDMAGVDDTVSLTTTNKGKPSLHVYIYTSIDWIAPIEDVEVRENGCRAWCRTDLEHSNVQFTNEHCDHETQSDRDMTVKEFRRNCKRRAADDLFQKPSKIMRQELQNINDYLEIADFDSKPLI